jgi:hypothetical protein
MSRQNTAAVVTAILTMSIWFSLPVSRKVQSPLAHFTAAAVISFPIYRLLCNGLTGRRP